MGCRGGCAGGWREAAAFTGEQAERVCECWGRRDTVKADGGIYYALWLRRDA